MASNRSLRAVCAGAVGVAHPLFEVVRASLYSADDGGVRIQLRRPNRHGRMLQGQNLPSGTLVRGAAHGKVPVMGDISNRKAPRSKVVVMTTIIVA